MYLIFTLYQIPKDQSILYSYDILMTNVLRTDDKSESSGHRRIRVVIIPPPPINWVFNFLVGHLRKTDQLHLLANLFVSNKDRMKIELQLLIFERIILSMRQYNINHDLIFVSMCEQHDNATNNKGFLDSIVIGYETLVYCKKLESKEQFRRWNHPESSKPRELKQTPSAGKVIATVHCDRQGLLLCEFLSTSTTTNADRYCQTLRKLRRAIENRRGGTLTRGMGIRIPLVYTPPMSQSISSTNFDGALSHTNQTVRTQPLVNASGADPSTKVWRL